MNGMSSSGLLLRLSRRLSTLPNPNPTPNTIPTDPPPFLRSTIRSLQLDPDLDVVAALFIRSSASPHFRNKRSIYFSTVRRLLSSNRPDLIHSILSHQTLYHDTLSEPGFAARLISLYTLASMPDRALNVFKSLPDPSLFSFNALLSAFSDPNLIADLIRQIPQSHPSIAPNVVSYNILILSLCNNGDLDGALLGLDLMGEKEISPNLITFNTLLNGFYSKGRILEGDRIWERMREFEIEPDIRSYNAKMRGLVEEGRVSEAVGVFGELRRIGLQADRFSFNALIKGYCEEGKWEEVVSVYKEMVEGGCKPDLLTFKMMVPGLLEAGEVDWAVRLCNESVGSGLFVESEVLQGVVDGLVREKKLRKAKQLVEHVKLKSKGRKKLRMPLACLAVGMR